MNVTQRVQQRQSDAVVAFIREAARQFDGLSIAPSLTFHNLPRKVFDEVHRVLGGTEPCYAPPDEHSRGYVSFDVLVPFRVSLFRKPEPADISSEGAAAIRKLERRIEELRELKGGSA